MRQDKNKSGKPAAAILLSFCLIALMSIFAVKGSMDKLQQDLDAESVSKKKAVEEETAQAQPTEIVDSIDNDNSPQESGNTGHKYIFPLEGDIINEFSINAPVYWKTLDQYMTHNGIDIASEIDTPVQACADGTVTKISNDDGMGMTVEINHGKGLISRYCNLSDEGIIELGEVVVQGQVIGKVGKTSMFEASEPGHLHFEMIKSSNYVNPNDYLK